MPVDRFLEEIVRWAEARPDLEAVALLGSYAQGRARAGSDIDLLLLTEDMLPYLDDPRWVGAFGEVDRSQREEWGAVTSLRVWYRDGREVEFGFAHPDWARVPPDPGTSRAVASGLRVLIDRTGQLSRRG